MATVASVFDSIEFTAECNSHIAITIGLTGKSMAIKGHTRITVRYGFYDTILEPLLPKHVFYWGIYGNVFECTYCMTMDERTSIPNPMQCL